MVDSQDDLAWLFALEPAKGGLERQIYRQILTAILDRRLAPGARLPASRALAASLGVSRGTVVAAFDQLVAEGYLDARTGRGTAVAALPDELLKAPGAEGATLRRTPVRHGGLRISLVRGRGAGSNRAASRPACRRSTTSRGRNGRAASRHGHGRSALPT